jgi:uncharacterized protein YaiE (UPF0345 family)
MRKESDMSRFDQVSVVKQANVFFDGKCVSHTVQFADGSKKTLGVILPATLTFTTTAPETMEGVAGTCRVRLKGESAWKTYGAGQSFSVPGNSSFDIEVSGEPYHYVCHFA